jgi:hypothetical protein
LRASAVSIARASATSAALSRPFSAHRREKVAEHNRQAKRDGGVHVLLFFLPIKAPWLMPLEGIFGCFQAH